MAYPLVSIIIINYNGKPVLYECLRSVLKTDYPKFEVILIDNGSKDGSVEFINSAFRNEPLLKIICTGKNLGFTGGNNTALKVANGKYLMLLNNDTVVDKNWLSEIVLAMESNCEIGVAQSKLLLLRDPKRFDTAGQPIDLYGFAMARGNKEIDYGQYNKIEDIFSASGAAMAIRNATIKEVGGLFDDDYFCYHEDVDLCWRMWLKGYRTIFVPKSIVFHARETSRSKLHEKKEYYQKSSFMMERNNLLTVLKNYSSFSLVRILPRYLSLSLSEFVLFVVTFKLRFATAEVRAIFWHIKNFKRTWRKRLIIQQNRVTPDSIIIRKMVQRSMKVQLIDDLFRSVKNRYKKDL